MPSTIGCGAGAMPGSSGASRSCLLVDELLAAVVGELVLVAHRQRARRARLDAQSAEDAAQVVDLVDAAVALAGREALLLGVVRALDVDRVGRAGPGAQLAADALLETVGVAVEQVAAVEARRGGLLLLGVLLGHDLLEHRAEGHAEALERAQEVGHRSSSVRASSGSSAGVRAAVSAGSVWPGSGGTGMAAGHRVELGRHLGLLVGVLAGRDEVPDEGQRRSARPRRRPP